MRLQKLLLLGFTLLVIAGCANSTLSDDPAARYKNLSAEQIYVKGQQALRSRNYNQATKLYEALASLYPFGPYAQKGQLDLIYAYYKSGDYASANAAADQYIHVYPRSAHVDYAYYMKGMSDMLSGETWLQRSLPVNLSLRDLDTSKQAFYDFRDIVQLFPHSKYAADAKRHMVYLRNLFAKHELYIANYYMKRHAYVAASNRASYIISHYKHTPQVEPALVILVQANRGLGLQQPANDALRVLKLNYPNSPALKKLA